MCKTIGNSCYSHNVSLLDVGSVILPVYDVTGTSLILGEQYKKPLHSICCSNLFSLRVFIIVHCSQKKPVVNYTLSCEKPLNDDLGKCLISFCIYRTEKAYRILIFIKHFTNLHLLNHFLDER